MVWATQRRAEWHNPTEQFYSTAMPRGTTYSTADLGEAT
jgi:hypothetical protein